LLQFGSHEGVHGRTLLTEYDQRPIQLQEEVVVGLKKRMETTGKTTGKTTWETRCRKRSRKELIGDSLNCHTSVVLGTYVEVLGNTI
jgi:hypothetical protein